MDLPVTESDTDTCSIGTNFPCEPISNFGKLRFVNSNAVFDVRGHLFNAQSSFVVWTVSAHLDPMAIPHSYIIEYKVHGRGTDRKCEGKLTETQVACEPWYPPCPGHLVILTLKLTAIDMVGPNGESFFPLVTHLTSYIERGPDFIFIGSDGKVTVPRRIIKLRSDALDAMFNHDFEEKQTNQIELRDFDTKTLTAFKNFLMSGNITEGKETALGLILLGDKYNVQSMKMAAEHFVKENIVDMDMDDVFNVFSKVCRESLYHAIVSKWIKEWINK